MWTIICLHEENIQFESFLWSQIAQDMFLSSCFDMLDLSNVTKESFISLQGVILGSFLILENLCTFLTGDWTI